jgi:hypothetical protein
MDVHKLAAANAANIESIATAAKASKWRTIKFFAAGLIAIPVLSWLTGFGSTAFAVILSALAIYRARRVRRAVIVLSVIALPWILYSVNSDAERNRWDSLTPAQQQAELKAKGDAEAKRVAEAKAEEMREAQRRLDEESSKTREAAEYDAKVAVLAEIDSMRPVMLASLRDPDSAKISREWMADGHVYCAIVNARNGFGGYVGDDLLATYHNGVVNHGKAAMKDCSTL